MIKEMDKLFFTYGNSINDCIIRIKKDTKLIDKFLMEMFDEYSKLKLNDANQKQ